MDILVDSCAGIDIHQKIMVACVLKSPSKGTRPKKWIESFDSTTKGLLQMHDWLKSHQCTVVAMESTGVYWKPVWHVLQEDFELILANPRMIKNVPGRKTDMKDAEWIAKLTRVGLVPPSFVPPEPIQDLRDLTRHRKHLTEDLTKEKNRAHKVLQHAGIKLTTYIRDLYGISGRNLLDALVNGEVLTPEKVEKLVYTSLKKKVPELIEALQGFVRKHHRFLLQIHLDKIDFIQEQIHTIEKAIRDTLEPHDNTVGILDEIPGINVTTASVILAEIGLDMSAFPSSKHLASWAGLAPGNHESAGKNYNARIRKGNAYLKKVLTQAALALSRGKDNRIKAFFWRIAKYKGSKKAIIATAHLLLRITYRLLKDNSRYIEFGEHYLQKRGDALLSPQS
ncbi:IS110 family transposase [Listeria booriae]|uniref:IS110 family transposase n=1 Tax=Listeria booriae TaxID=1552123 RepID=UPI0016288C17|nr:IS110 family transposase [Listeria booriae]MBC2037678.1 IS110 family transposase [Listeria booriae]